MLCVCLLLEFPFLLSFHTLNQAYLSASAALTGVSQAQVTCPHLSV